MEKNLVNEFFPKGLRIMVVDNDEKSLKTAKAMLLSFNYKVMTCKNPIIALSILEERHEEFDLLLTELCMEEMNGIQLLDIVHSELELPVVLMGAVTNTNQLVKIFMHGASYFLPKPLEAVLVRNIWKHVAWHQAAKEKKLKKRDDEKKQNKGKNVIIIDEDDDNTAKTDKRKGKRIASSQDNDVPEIKRQRVIWTPELEGKFENALNKLGKDAVPRKIASVMNVEGVDRQHVASHLQKHKLKKQRAANVAEAVRRSLPSTSHQFSANPNPNPNAPPTMPQPQKHMITSSQPMYHISHVKGCLNNLMPNNDGNAVQPIPNQAQELATNTEDVSLPLNSDDFTEFMNSLPELPTLSNNDFSRINGGFSLAQPPLCAPGDDDVDISVFLYDEMESQNTNNLQTEEERNGANNQVPIQTPMDLSLFENLDFVQQQQQQHVGHEGGSSSKGGEDGSFTGMTMNIIADKDDLSCLDFSQFENLDSVQQQQQQNDGNVVGISSEVGEDDGLTELMRKITAENDDLSYLDFNQLENLDVAQQQQQQSDGNEVGISSEGGDDEALLELVRRIAAENNDYSYMNDGFPADDMF